MASYSTMYFWGEYGSRKDNNLGIYWLKRSADAGYSVAQAVFAQRLYYGMDVDRDIENALKYAVLAEKSGSPRAAWLLAVYYGVGVDGVGIDYDKSFNLMKASAEKGYRPAMRDVAILYSKGRGVQKNYEEALAWIKKAADDECYECYNEGSPIKETYREVVEEISRNSIILSKYYYLGVGTEKNCDSAFRWLQRGLKATRPENKSDALHLLALMTREGCGVQQDEAKARVILEQANTLTASKQGEAE